AGAVERLHDRLVGDLEIGRKNDVTTLFSVDLDGTIFPEVELPGDGAPSIAGVFFKDADKTIMKALDRAGFLFRRARVVHAYPFCWRDGAPLLYYAKRSWYIRTTAVKDKLLSNNADINWVPQHIQTGRFGNWLENNIDWAISRERYWGTPLPIWTNENASKLHCIGSVEELSKLTGRDLSELDLHRPYIDEITFEIDGETFRRVPYTIDVWFESGAMPYAQWHYPFENQEEFKNAFPADYICEAMDQTRGWFYSLHAIATLLTDPGDGDRAPGPLAELAPSISSFRNCMVLGFINDAQGRKMSKSRGNTVDPWEVVGKSGADALRWYLFISGSPDQNKSFDPAGVHEGLRAYFLTLWNLYSFFVSYARLDGPDLSQDVPFAERPFLDRWILSRLQKTIAETTERLDGA
ncbi:MAG: class I tRNA ligase family protein, partial [Acidobacteriota bacterium]